MLFHSNLSVWNSQLTYISLLLSWIGSFIYLFSLDLFFLFLGRVCFGGFFWEGVVTNIKYSDSCLLSWYLFSLSYTTRNVEIQTEVGVGQIWAEFSIVWKLASVLVMTRIASSNFISYCAQTHKSPQLIKESPIMKLPFLFPGKHRVKQQSGQTKQGRRIRRIKSTSRKKDIAFWTLAIWTHG